MRILGIDPGTRVAGYGVVDLENNQIRGIAAGAWRLDAKQSLAGRLAALAIEFRRVLDVYKPETLCVELAFVAENVRSALFLGHARGVILAEAHLRGLVIHEISATAAKKSIVNYGRADKQMIAQTLSTLLGVNFEKLPYDASDALGLAYAQALRERMSFSQPISFDATACSTKEQSEFLKSWAQGKKKKKQKKVGFESLMED